MKVALLRFQTQRPRGAFVDGSLADVARALIRRGVGCRLFQVYFSSRDSSANRRNVEDLIVRLKSGGYRWVAAMQFWTPEVAARLNREGFQLIEMQQRTIPESLLIDPSSLIEYPFPRSAEDIAPEAGAVVSIGGESGDDVVEINLGADVACGYRNTIHENPFFDRVKDDPQFAGFRGCSYCRNAVPKLNPTSRRLADQLVEKIGEYRKLYPCLRTVWINFPESMIEPLELAVRSTSDPDRWRGLDFGIQLRPDTVASDHSRIESLAALARSKGARLRVGVVGFENFSSRELQILNRGTSLEQMHQAAKIVRRWLGSEPEGMLIKNFTPSFILFNPWTRMDDLIENSDAMESYGFWNARIWRLRAGPGTPIHEKARQDGLLADIPSEAAVHPNGYTSECVIRFQDPRVGHVCAGFEALLPHAESDQLELLRAVMAAVDVAGGSGPDWTAIGDRWLRIKNGTL